MWNRPDDERKGRLEAEKLAALRKNLLLVALGALVVMTVVVLAVDRQRRAAIAAWRQAEDRVAEATKKLQLAAENQPTEDRAAQVVSPPPPAEDQLTEDQLAEDQLAANRLAEDPAAEAARQQQAIETREREQAARRAAENARDEASRARDVLRVAAARESAEELTRRIGWLREVEAAEPASVHGWTPLAEAVLAELSAGIILRHGGELRSAVFSPDGDRILTASVDRTARVWNVDGQGEPLVLRHAGAVSRATFSPDGSKILTHHAERSIRIWNVDGTGEPVGFTAVDAAVFSPDGTKILTRSRSSGVVLVRDADGAGEAVELKGHRGRIYSAVFSPDGSRVLTASRDETARLWDVDGRGEPLVFRGHEGIVLSADFSPDGSRILTTGEDRTARVWNVELGGDPIVFQHTGHVDAALFSPGGDRVLTLSDRKVRLWTLDTGEATPLGPDAPSSAVFNHAGDRILMTSSDGTARVWNVDGSGEPRVLRGHGGSLVDAAFSPDDTKIVTASRDRTARVWYLVDIDQDASAGDLRRPLWQATSVCPAAEERVRLLDQDAEAARKDHDTCTAMVRCLRDEGGYEDCYEELRTR